MQEQRLIAFCISSHQGFSSDHLEKDVSAIRIFDKEGLEFFVAQSFASNFGLYSRNRYIVAIVVVRQ